MEKIKGKCPDCGALEIWQHHVSDSVYQCDFCGEANEHGKEVRRLKDIRLHQAKGGRGSTIQVNYGQGWEKIKIHIEE